MNEIPPETRRIQSMLTSLIIVTILIVSLMLVIWAYPTVLKPALAPATPLIPSPRSSSETLTPAASLTPTLTNTLRPTLTPTITPTPTQTLLPSETPTPPGPPNLTPAQPVRSDPYKLGEWTSDLANLSIELMNDYPNTLIPRLRGEDNRGFFDAFFYATLAGREGIMRFPDAPQALQWHFDLAYNLAQMGDPAAGAAYAELFTRALNQGSVEPEDLTTWFASLEPRLRLNQIELTPPSGYLSSRILEVHGPGSAFIWLLETPTGFQSTVLDSNFDFINNPEMRLIVADLTGDGLDDGAIFNSAPSDTTLEQPRVFDLSAAPAGELAFRPSESVFNPGMEYTNNWRVSKSGADDASAGFDLLLDLQLFPACPVNVQQTFHWNGTYFERASAEYTVKPSLAGLNICGFIVEHAANTWGPQAAVQIMESLLPLWPPAENEAGKPYPADAKDEWRYRLGVNHALLGNFDQATAYLEELVENPTTPSSRWVEPAKTFLQLYTKPQDIYRACAQAQFCDPDQALDYLVNQLGIPDGVDPIQYLNERGLVLRASGYFDFDGDDVKERWFTVRHRPLEKLNLWVLAQTTAGQRALSLGTVEGDRPSLQALNPEEQPSIIWIDAGTYATFDRDKDTGQPAFRLISPSLEFPDRFKLGVEAARKTLLEEQDFQKALEMLTALEQTPGLLCKSTFTCDEYFYLLGLANELLGNDRAAITAYLSLWSDYARSPFTTLARLKLAATLIPPTPIATATLTAFPTGLLTPGTPTVTFTPTLTPIFQFTPTATFPGFTPPPTQPVSSTITPPAYILPTPTEPAYP